jgi:DNA gyrase subunit A
VNDNDELVIITKNGMVIRQSVKELRVMGRNTQGVRLIRLNEDDSIADIARVVSEDEDLGENGKGTVKTDSENEAADSEESLDL